MNQRIGYARVSTDDQHLDLQREALRLAGVGTICEETARGKDAARRELDRCLTALQAGDTLVVWRFDTLGRSLPDLVNIVAGLEEKGVGFESIAEKIETTSAAGKLVFHVFAALAEFERNLIRERTRAGLVAARARGRAGGRKPKLDARQIREIEGLMSDSTIPVGQIAERYKVSRTTIYKVAPRSVVPANESQLDTHEKVT
jgi:DNA invertase Pin-like site-specific DNA recombinase